MAFHDFRFKILLIGDSGVGKSTIRKRLVSDTEGNISSTVGIDLDSIRLNVNGFAFNFVIFDVGGQTHYSSIRNAYYKGADTIVMVYDVSNPNTLLNLLAWVDELLTADNSERARYILVGNKKDLNVKITQEQLDFVIRELEKKGIKIEDTILVSAFTGENIKKLLKKIVKASILRLVESRRKAENTVFL